MQYQSYILRIYLGPTPFQPLSLLTTVNWGATTLADIGHYFTTGYTSTLTLHPGKSNQSTASVATVFNNHSIKNSSGVSPLPSPIQYSCQKSYAVLMTDGLPTKDWAISSVLQDYDGDCSGSNASNCIAPPHYDMKINGVYEVALLEPSDYLDDVAQALYEMDLRPNLIKKAGQKNNVASYVIGFADEQVLNNPLLQDAASQGGGLFIAAKNSSEIATALQNAFTDIIAKNSSAASVATNSTRLDTGTLIYQAKFNSGDWSGHLLAYQINPDGSVGDLKWDAADLIPAPSTRNIFSYNPTATGTKGISFLWNNLNSTQQAALHTLNGTNDSKGQDRLDYLRGDQSKEQASGPFRKRSVLLGDIINSDPWFVGTENFGYHRLPPPEGPAYTTFRNGSSYTGRRKMVYVGVNDGMLHGFDAANDTTNGGKEIFAYIPNAIISKLSKLTDPTYGATTNPHQYFVDGAPKAGDAYINGWKTLLAGTLGVGGKGVFVLDVTNPDGFDATDVLWEVTDTTGPDYADLGYTLPQPSVVRLANGDWGVIVANGYDSASKKAVLYILGTENGSIIKKFDTLVGNVSNPNGLSMPIAVDKDNDRIVDVIFAGDLQGNLWEFDVSDPAGASAWDFAYGGAGPKPFFVACSDQSNCANTRQPITAKPQVGKGPDGQGIMVYFGTGKYFEIGDNIVGPSPQVQTYYALRENGAQVSGRSVLQEQTILAEGTVGSTPVRVTSDSDVDYNSNQEGWYMDLTPPSPSSPAGERVVSPSLLRGGRIIFVSIIPESDPCSFGGTSWLYELDALSGSRLSTAQFDVNGDGKIDKADLVQILDTNNDGVVDAKDDVPPSGKELPIGISKNPSVIPAGDYEYKYSSGTTGGIAVTKEKGAEESGRLSWRQLQ
jgi:type IV pilus assembly protein PilY1